MNETEHIQWLEDGIRIRAKEYDALVSQQADLVNRMERVRSELEALQKAVIVLRPERASALGLPQGRFAEMSIADAAATLLKEQGPMKVTELIKAIQEGGKVIGGSPYNSLTNILVKSSRFKWVSKGEYGLVEK